MTEVNRKYKRFFKPLKNIFVLILIIFCVWMLFFDSNSWFIHNELNKEVNKLEEEKEYYQGEIEKDNKEIEELSTDEGMEKYGRQEYNMKKEKEDIYIIEYQDSLKTKKEND